MNLPPVRDRNTKTGDKRTCGSCAFCYRIHLDSTSGFCAVKPPAQFQGSDRVMTRDPAVNFARPACEKFELRSAA